jgi:formamidopyrimidine-DNA glycosylase
MPELPEVETIKRRLSELLPGRVIKQTTILREKSFAGDPRKLSGLEVKKITRRAKLLRFHLPNNLNLLTHLKMTGQLIFVDGKRRVGGGHPTADWVKDLPSNHTRIIYEFLGGSWLYFNDMRVFGWMRLMTNHEIDDYYSKYGPDVVGDKNLTIDYLVNKLSRRNIPIKQAIMLNQIMAGVGNIYASDALNVAQISPLRPAKSLSKNELKNLLIAIKQVINESLKHGGTTFDGRYVDVDGLEGSYQQQLKVYGREGQSCRQCDGKIVKINIGGRGTYYCSRCQQ